MAIFDPTYKRYGIRATLERITFWIYSVSIVSTIVPLYYFVINSMFDQFGSTNGIMMHQLLVTGLFSAMVWLMLTHFGYKYLHFAQHENIFETDEYLDFHNTEHLDKFIKLKKLANELNNDYNELSSHERKLIRQAIEELIIETKNDDEISY